MFDTYSPKDQVCCPVCDTPLKEWQGKDGPCILEAFKEGSFIDHNQPNEFEIYSDDCECRNMVEALCSSENGIWMKTQIIDAAHAFQKKHERKSDFKERLNWLKSNET